MSFRVECSRVTETDDAVLVELAGHEREEVWFPLSQVDEMHFDARGNGYILIADWLARKRGLL